ncbi:MAG: hypothetical protein RLZZ127_2988 [Planctomycetota bacterium]|jgi:hypothetical protein
MRFLILGVMAAVVGVIVVLALGERASYRPVGDTPEEVHAAIQRLWRDQTRLTEGWVGERFTPRAQGWWRLVNVQPQVAVDPVTLWAGRTSMDTYEIHRTIGDGWRRERIAWIFRRVDGRWMVDDIHLFEVAGIRWDMPISRVAADPTAAAADLAARHEGQGFAVALGGTDLPQLSFLIPALRLARR